MRDFEDNRGRPYCLECRKAKSHCYCSELRPFAAGAKLVILQHPREARERVGTARMLKRSVSNSELFVGVNFENDPRLEALLADPAYSPAVLYPGPRALDLDSASCVELRQLFPRTPLILLLDGTWDLAKALLRNSPRLHQLPQIRFTPKQESRYRFRRQPRPECLSTLEAAHTILDAFDASGFQATSPPRVHDHLLVLFERMVERQLAYSGK